jgi:hypothetical protein
VGRMIAKTWSVMWTGVNESGQSRRSGPLGSLSSSASRGFHSVYYVHSLSILIHSSYQRRGSKILLELY